MSQSRMTLKVWTPEQLTLHEKADKIVAEAPGGFFCLLPRHIDFLSELTPGILSYTLDGDERYLAVNRGILVKCGPDVMVSVRSAVQGEYLEDLEHLIRETFQKIDEKEHEITIAMNQLEADFIRRFVEVNKQRGRS
ncbi:MAG: F0F1 ATP synthase subunit epsilon [Balneolaceae bacterium]|nr:F0F1 ATP synthase subunit epsilon [Balneolaceae bacterium]